MFDNAVEQARKFIIEVTQEYVRGVYDKITYKKKLKNLPREVYDLCMKMISKLSPSNLAKMKSGLLTVHDLSVI